MKTKHIIILSLTLLIFWCSFPRSGEASPKIFKGKLAFDANAFVVDNARTYSGVYLFKDGKVKFLAKAGLGGWSPDGSLLAICEGNNIYIVKEDGSIIETISTPDKCCCVQWHPKENKIFYACDDVKRPDLKYFSGRYTKKIYIYDRDKKEATLLYFDNDKRYDILRLYISPDGKYMAFELMGDLSHGVMNDLVGGVYIVDINGSNMRLVYRHGILYGWFPDSKNLCYEANIDEHGNLMTGIGATAGYIFKYNIETKTHEKIGHAPFSFNVKISRDGKYIYYTGGGGICVAPIEDVSKSELIVGDAVINPKTGNKSQEYNSDWYQEQ